MRVYKTLYPFIALDDQAKAITEALESEVAPAYDGQFQPLEGLNRVYTLAYTLVQDELLPNIDELENARLADEQGEGIHQQDVDDYVTTLETQTSELKALLEELNDFTHLEPEGKNFAEVEQAREEFQELLEDAIEEATT